VKFACPKCSTRYSIADEKVPPAKTLRFPCKKCGNVIRLQRKKQAAKKAAKPVKQKAPTAGPSHLDAGATRVAPLDELNKLRGEAAVPAGGNNDGASATKVASVKDIQQALAADETAPVAPDERGAGTEEEWYVLIAGKQQGPMTALKVVDMLTRNEIDKRTYVWRDGMGDWKRVGAMTEFRDLAQRVGDAAWRVMAPVNEQGAPESTVAMDARQLQEQLQRVRDENSSSGFEDEDTRQMDMSAAQAALGQEVITSPTAAIVDPTDRSTEINSPLNLSDPAVIDALSGEPTGERMTRPISGEKAQELLGAPELFPESSTDDLFPIAPNEPEPFSEADIFTPASGAAAAHDPLEFNEPSSGEMFSEAGGFPDATEEPVDAPINGLSGASDDFFEGDEKVPPSPEYLDAPPGESTRVFMATAGLYKRRRTHRIAAAVGIVITILVMAIVALDIMKVVELPGMGAIYAGTGITDPNLDRGLGRVETALAKADLTPEKRARLEENRKKYQELLGGGQKPGGGGGDRTDDSGTGGGSSKRKGVNREGVKDTTDLDKDERDTLKDVFDDDRKSENAIQLAAPDRIETPNLPDGLSQKAIIEVFKESARSIQLCYSESSRKGEQLAGKMVMEVTIAADGSVTDVIILTDHFKRTIMATCTVRRVKSWRFPKFNGEPVTVELPYIVAPVL